MKTPRQQAAVFAVTLILSFSVIAALLVKVGGLSIQAMLGWQLALSMLGALSVIVTRSGGNGGGGGGRGKPILAYAPIRRAPQSPHQRLAPSKSSALREHVQQQRQ